MRPLVLLGLWPLLATAASAAEKPCTPVARAVEERICAEVVGASARELLNAIWVPLFEDYARRTNLQPTEDEIGRMTKLFDQVRAPGVEPGELEARFVRNLVLSWKVGRELHRQHGGRVSLSSFGLHMPIEALQVFLREEERRGSFQIHDDRLRKAFWQEITTGMQGDGIADDPEARLLYRTPPWEARPEEPPTPSAWRGREGELERLKERVRGILAAEGRAVDFARLTILAGRKDDLLVGRVIYESEQEIVVDLEPCRSGNVFHHLRKPYVKQRAGSQRCGSQEYEILAVRQN